MRWKRLDPEALRPVGSSGVFSLGLSVTVEWLRPVVAMSGYQAVVDISHVDALAVRLSPIRRAMRAGRMTGLDHECQQIFPHYVARFAVYDIGGFPCCILTGWQGPRKHFTVALGWRELSEFANALVSLRVMANEYRRKGRTDGDQSTLAGVGRREARDKRV